MRDNYSSTIIAFLLWTLFILIAVGGCLKKAHSQTLTKKVAEVSSNVRFDQSQGSIFDTVLFRADSLLRIGDAVTSHLLFSDPCHCFVEGDPIAPKGSGTIQIVAFQYAALMAIQKAHSILIERKHKKLARMVYVLDIASESYAVGHNTYLLQGYRPNAN